MKRSGSRVMIALSREELDALRGILKTKAHERIEMSPARVIRELKTEIEMMLSAGCTLVEVAETLEKNGAKVGPVALRDRNRRSRVAVEGRQPE